MSEKTQHKIAKAYAELTETKVNFEEYAKLHNVSDKALRQVRRFLTQAKKHMDIPGWVFIKMNSETGVREIWRDSNAVEPPLRVKKSKNVEAVDSNTDDETLEVTMQSSIFGSGEDIVDETVDNYSSAVNSNN